MEKSLPQSSAPSHLHLDGMHFLLLHLNSDEDSQMYLQPDKQWWRIKKWNWTAGSIWTEFSVMTKGVSQGGIGVRGIWAWTRPRECSNTPGNKNTTFIEAIENYMKLQIYFDLSGYILLKKDIFC